MKTAEQLFGLGKTAVTAGYVPSQNGAARSMYRRIPPFTTQRIADMITEPVLNLGLRYIKGPIISRTRFVIDTDVPELQQFIETTLKRFWMNSASRVLKAIDWGWSCCEVLYRHKDGMVYFDNVRDLQSTDCRCLVRDGEVVGSTVRSIKQEDRAVLAGPKCLWHVHDRDVHAYYGRSRLYGSFVPFLEHSQPDSGFRQSRRLFFSKYSYSGGGMYYPLGQTKIPGADGSIARTVNNVDLAREQLDYMRNGATLAIPNKTDATGKREWEIIPSASNGSPAGLAEYGLDLKEEMLEGLGIPPEVIKSDGTGAYGGRQIPQEGFLSTIQELSQWLFEDVNRQILEPMIEFNFGLNSTDYDVTVSGILGEEEGVTTEEQADPLTQGENGKQGDSSQQGDQP